MVFWTWFLNVEKWWRRCSGTESSSRYSSITYKVCESDLLVEQFSHVWVNNLLSLALLLSFSRLLFSFALPLGELVIDGYPEAFSEARQSSTNLGISIVKDRKSSA